MDVYFPNETLLLQRSDVVFAKIIQEFIEILEMAAEPSLQQKEKFAECVVCLKCCTNIRPLKSCVIAVAQVLHHGNFTGNFIMGLQPPLESYSTASITHFCNTLLQE